jgi:hypothetical protein
MNAPDKPCKARPISNNHGTGVINIAVSLSALFSGLFIVGAGDVADKFGRVKMTYVITMELV